MTYPVVAWQREIRDRRAREELDADLFGRWWEGIDRSIGNGVVRETTFDTAKAIIEDYEWLGSMPHITLLCYGIFFDGACGGVVCYAPEYIENLGRWDRYGYTGKIILLARGACVHWAHPHSGSKLIMGSVKLLPPRYEVVTAMADRRAGEYGTLYQACGWHYVGAMREISGLVKRQSTMMVDGRPMAHRTMKQRFGTANRVALTARFPEAQFIQDIDKDRYFCFRGSRKAKRLHVNAISHLIKPYPKRDATPRK